MTKIKQSRRSFLANGGAVLSASWVALNMPALLAAGEAAQDNRNAAAAYKSITPEQAVELGAFADQIIPPGDTPGAVDIGVVYFMDAAFGMFLAGDKPIMERGLREWHGKAKNMNPNAERFSQLTPGEQTTFLKAEEEGSLFSMLYRLVLLGMFSSPGYGGNHNGEGWKLLGFDKQHAWQPPFGYYDAQAMGSTDYSGEHHA
ncbi:MAG: gluconate 2-dehydrogenase subunit 3 family protein [Pseudomonadales bacterium]|nr:gluconate 2-dehydrogenase subunit 3 family protein [Halioglobus sp.]MCP5128885.1 gluconate 2-dehydrogenase subunit 3 family protein [Pseudomonadales bacterium]